MFYLLLITLILVLAKQFKTTLKFLHIMQLETYKGNQYISWLWKNANVTFNQDILFSTAMILMFFALILALPLKVPFAIFLILFSAYCIYDLIPGEKVKEKKKLVYTHRLIRLLITSLFIISLEVVTLVFVLFLVQLSNLNQVGVYNIYFSGVVSLLLFNIIMPINIYIANIINYPIEFLVQLKFKNLAKRKLKGFENLKVIGITGSYGKTSTKNFLNTILSEKYKVLMTPASFNTPMGLCKVVNNQLNSEHEILIAEMGARYTKDIKELCDLVKPSIGIITSIGPQHLETFKSIENIIKTKFELIDSLPENGLAVLNADNEYCMGALENVKVKKSLFGTNNDKADIFAWNIKYSSEGTSFEVRDNKGNQIECNTKLLGKHNVDNILAAISVALELGMTFEEIKNGIQKLEPVEHRLQIVPTTNGVTVIDDAFNSNPIGSKMALDVLKTFTSGQKIIITPGLVELGSEEKLHNIEFGKNIAEVCDKVILVGEKRTAPIKKGLVESGYLRKNIVIVKNLDEATIKLGQFIKPGDIVLFENDLPDNYNE